MDGGRGGKKGPPGKILQESCVRWGKGPFFAGLPYNCHRHPRKEEKWRPLACRMYCLEESRFYSNFWHEQNVQDTHMYVQYHATRILTDTLAFDRWCLFGFRMRRKLQKNEAVSCWQPVMTGLINFALSQPYYGKPAKRITSSQKIRRKITSFFTFLFLWWSGLEVLFRERPWAGSTPPFGDQKRRERKPTGKRSLPLGTYASNYTTITATAMRPKDRSPPKKKLRSHTVGFTVD